MDDLSVSLHRLVARHGLRQVLIALGKIEEERANRVMDGPMGDKLAIEQGNQADRLAEHLTILADF